MKTRLLLLTLCLLSALPRLSAQTAPEPYAADWTVLDSLLNYDLSVSAAQKAQQVYEKAQRASQPVQQLKAQLYLLYALQNNDRTDSPQRALAMAEEQARTQPFPVSNIWHSYAAELYYRYFQNYGWRIRQRTAMASADSTTDISEWSADRILQTAAMHYRASLRRADELIKTGLTAYRPVILSDSSTAALRPTLYDLLAFRALGYFESGFQGLTRPADVFTLDDPRYFGTTADFVALKIVTTDSSSSEAQALRIFQQLLRLHQSDANGAALIDAELHRLEFVYNHATLENKDSLYEKALMALAEQWKDHPGAAEAMFKVQRLRYNREDRKENAATGDDPSRLPRIRTALEAIVRKYPGSEGAANAAALLRELLQTSLSAEAEDVVLPAEPSKFLLHYRNVSTVYLRLLRANAALSRTPHFYYIDSLTRATIGGLPSVREWQQPLPSGDDYRGHAAEIRIDALAEGSYLLLVSDSAAWQSDSTLTYMVPFQVSRLSVVTLSDGSGKTAGAVADRKTGAPLAGVSIRLEVDVHDPKTKKTAPRIYTALSGKDGAFEVTGGYFQRLLAVRSGDSLYHNAGYSFRQSKEKKEKDTKADTTIWFFTDRAIYRPGQEVFFKGIAIRTFQGKSQVLPAYHGSVLLSDANDVDVDSLAVTANEFGSFHGSFRLPAGSLTGEWTIEDDFLNGEQSIQVEEYKRPRFEVSFDTLAGSYRLNREVTIRGAAVSFSGANVDGAQIEYVVTRRPEYPWLFSGSGGRYSYSPAQIVAEGKAVTDAQGRFAIRFFSKAPQPLDTDAVYRFEVSATITDAAGETRVGTVSLRAGYRSLILSTPLSSVVQLSGLDSFRVFTSNLNRIFQPADVRVTVEALQPPAQPLRERYWQVPDRFTMDSATFKRFFPNDEYRNEGNPEHWPRRQVFSTSKRSRRDGLFGLPRTAFAANGHYRLLLSSRDSNGKEVRLERYVKLQDARLPQSGNDALSLTVKTKTPVAGSPVEALIQSSFEPANVFKVTENGSAETLSTQSLQEGEAAVWNAGILSPEARQLKLLVWTVRDNRLYKAEKTIALETDPGELQVSWASHRDKLQPGAAETWTMTVKGAAGEKVAAEMAAALYDASLDQFAEHSWEPNALPEGPVPNINLEPLLFSEQSGTRYTQPREYYAFELPKAYPVLLPSYHQPPGLMFAEMRQDGTTIQTVQVAAGPRQLDRATVIRNTRSVSGIGYFAAGARQKEKSAPEMPGMALQDQIVAKDELGVVPGIQFTPPDSGPAPITPRRNLRETAFFFPELRTDAEGNTTFSFTLPEALTQWRLLAFAHTNDLLTGHLEGTVRTQKDLMVVPGLPRFLRQGDTIALTAKITNLAGHALSGTAKIEILDAATLQPLSTSFRLLGAEQPFSAASASSTALAWNLTVPLARYEPVVIRITARSGAFTDGEDNTLPVLTNRTLVTETQPLWLNGNGTKSFSFPSLAQSLPPRGSGEGAIAPHSLTVEYTSNPAWLALQSLPYLAEYPYECAEQTFNRYYANALAAHILRGAPKLRAIFARWQQSDTAALLSRLELNPELKSALLEETPWVLEAADERGQRANMARLFSASGAAAGFAAALHKLRALQSDDGSFPWFGGGNPDRYITQYIATGLARMQKLGVKLSGDGEAILSLARQYLDESLVRDYRETMKRGNAFTQQQINPLQVQYLYLNSLQPQEEPDTAAKNALRYYTGQAARYWNTFNPYLKGMIALALKAGKSAPPPVPTILQSLRETAIRDGEQGVYWVRPGAGYYWHEAPIEAQALLIECFAAAGDSTMVRDAKRWLLKQKQGQHWASTKATADACYALLLTGAAWTSATPQVSIRLGDYSINSESEKTEAGTGYFKRRIPREQIAASMSTITVEVKGSTSAQPSWGAVYYQYFADMDAVRPSSGDSSRPKAPLSVKKQFFVVRNTKSGEVLEAITGAAPLKVGDKVRVRIVLTADRAMDYVHLKDSRPSCLEPVDVLSGYRWHDGLGYYQSTRDASSNFFIDHLSRGTAVFEYSLFVTSKGDFGAGLATAQCMYAPEFAAHSQGMRIEVR